MFSVLKLNAFKSKKLYKNEEKQQMNYVDSFLE